MLDPADMSTIIVRPSTVHARFPKVLTLEFCTELTFISIKPFSLEFFGMVLLKAILHIFLKGGLMLKLHIKLREWCELLACWGCTMIVKCTPVLVYVYGKGQILGRGDKIRNSVGPGDQAARVLAPSNEQHHCLPACPALAVLAEASSARVALPDICSHVPRWVCKRCPAKLVSTWFWRVCVCVNDLWYSDWQHRHTFMHICWCRP